MRILLVMCALAIVSTNAYSRELVTHIDDGTIYVSKNKASIQIYINQHNKVHQLSNFSNWEKIESLFVSPNKKYLIAYHKADKKSHYRVTLFDIDKRVAIADTAPGMACDDIQWFKDRILFITGTTGGGTIVYVYNYNLKKLFDMGGGRLFIDVKNGISFSYPTYSADDGMFTEYDLNTGAKIRDFNFKKEVGEGYICDSVSPIGERTYQLVLWTLSTHKHITVKETFDK